MNATVLRHLQKLQWWSGRKQDDDNLWFSIDKELELAKIWCMLLHLRILGNVLQPNNNSTIWAGSGEMKVN